MSNGSEDNTYYSSEGAKFLWFMCDCFTILACKTDLHLTLKWKPDLVNLVFSVPSPVNLRNAVLFCILIGVSLQAKSLDQY